MAKEESVVLLGFWVSPFAMRVRIALEEKGVGFEAREEDVPNNKSELLLKSNPIYKKVPVLIHGEKVVCESAVILNYIEEVWPSPSLLPTCPYERSQARFWADYIDKKLFEGGGKIWKGKGEEQKAAVKEFLEVFKVLEGALGEKDYFGGDSFGYTDIIAIPLTSWIYAIEQCGGFKLEVECPKFSAWMNRCMQRETVAKTLPDPEKVYEFVRMLNKIYCGSLEPMPMPAADGGIAHALFVSKDRRIPKIRIQTQQLGNLLDKRIIVAVDSWDCLSRYPSGHYVRTIGEICDRDTESEVILIENDINSGPFSSQVLACLPPLPWTLSADDLANPNRQDLRQVRVFSVDSPGCKEIDDALHCTPLPNGNFEVGVHIADVTNFVYPGTPLDDEASQRGTSVYLVDRLIDMLPKPLTEDICSLRSDVERLAFSVIWEMTPDADIISTRYTKSVIKSCAALSYVEAQAKMDDSRLMDPLTTDLRNMNTLAKIMRLRRIERGALTFASAEVKFQIDTETHDPLDIGKYQIREANQMVEEFMLAANVSVAEKILKHFPMCSLLRRHPSPTKERFEPLLRTTAAIGLDLDTSSSKALADSLDRAVGNDPYFNKLIRILAARCMTQAVYFCSGDLSPPEFHHYGLAVPLFTHFTSPKRRYADVIVHRLLAAALGIDKLPPIFQDRPQLTGIADNLNYRHRNARMARRASEELDRVIRLRKQPTDTEARIMKILSNGFIVFVPESVADPGFKITGGTIKWYDFEGPVYLRGEKGRDWLVDEEHQRVTKADASISYSILQAVKIHMKVVERPPNRPKLELTLI